MIGMPFDAETMLSETALKKRLKNVSWELHQLQLDAARIEDYRDAVGDLRARLKNMGYREGATLVTVGGYLCRYICVVAMKDGIARVVVTPMNSGRGPGKDRARVVRFQDMEKVHDDETAS